MVRVAGKAANPPDTVGNAKAARVTVLQAAVGSKRLAAQEVVFQPTGLRDLEGASLTGSRMGET